MTATRRLRYGAHAWLVEHDDPAGLTLAIRAAGRADVIEVVPGAATTVVVLAPDTDVESAGAWLDTLAARTRPGEAGAAPGALIEVPVVYDGADLAAVAAATGLGVAEVVARHRDATYRCAFCGFAPGFGYLTGLDPALHVPRRATPRTRIPPGAVAVAGGYTAVYPSASPGGWHLLGHTTIALWRPERNPPALITPGATVRFVERGT